jgi:hypothetical protein
LLRVIQISRALAEGPEGAFEVGSRLGQGVLETPQRRRTQRIDSVALVARDMKAVEYNPRMRQHLLHSRDRTRLGSGCSRES